MTVEVELPCVYVDDILEDEAPSGLILINRSPAPNETNVALNQHIEIDIADVDDVGAPDVATLTVYVAGVLAVDDGVFQPGWDGVASSMSFVQADLLRCVLDYQGIFVSKQTIEVRVLCTSTSGAEIDITYSFVCADVSPPVLLSATALDMTRVRVRFDEPVRATDPVAHDDVLNPENWELERLGDGLHPVVAARVVRVEPQADNEFDLEMSIPLTPRGLYRAYVTEVCDLPGNEIAAPYNQVSFFGRRLPQPIGRDVDLYRLLPEMNRREDETKDLLRFVLCLQEVFELLLSDVDGLANQFDPDFAAEDRLDAMLSDLGNPFAFDLTVQQKRRLIRILVPIYKLKGTEPGIVAAILFFLQVAVTITIFNVDEDTLVLGESELGEDWILGASSSFLRFSFAVNSERALTDSERRMLRAIVRYMKPINTHFVRLNEPVIPEVIDHLELGRSALGTEWILH